MLWGLETNVKTYIATYWLIDSLTSFDPIAPCNTMPTIEESTEHEITNPVEECKKVGPFMCGVCWRAMRRNSHLLTILLLQLRNQARFS